MDWQSGRLGTGYKKLKLARGSFWDAWLLHFPKGSFVPPHTDPVKGKKLYRLNILLFGQDNFRPKSMRNVYRLGPFTLFRADLVKHHVSTTDRARFVLSIGVAL